MTTYASTSLQETAAQLLAETTSGTLSTFSIRCSGTPFGSWVPFATNDRGNPIFLISSLAEHSRNLIANPQASLCIVEASRSRNPARLTILGKVLPVSDDAKPQSVTAYLAKHPHAQLWLEMSDFQLFELTSHSAYLVAGFGQMGWIDLQNSK